MTRPPTGAPEPALEDPCAVHVRLAPVSGADAGPLTVAPAPEPLRMLEPSTGIGVLGGIAPPTIVRPAAAPPTDDAPGSEDGLVPRHLPLVDGRPTAALVRVVRPGTVMLVENDEPATTRTRVLVGPPRLDDGVERREVVVDGWRFEVEVEPARRAALRERARRGRGAAAAAGPLEIRAIIPGRVVAVSVAPGDEVTAGQQILVVEAMKMQNELRAPRDGTIDRVAAAPGSTVDVGDLLLVIA